MPPPFATAEELRLFLGLEEGELDAARAELVVAAISDEIRSACGWPVTAIDGVEAVLDGPVGPHLLLPTLHLRAVSSLVEDDRLLVAGRDYVVYRYGRVTRAAHGRPTPWSTRLQAIAVVYDHGYPEGAVPPAITAVCLEAAARLAGPDNPAGLLKSRTVARISVTYADIRQAVSPITDARLDTHRLADAGMA